jgi:replicative DNA helicase
LRESGTIEQDADPVMFAYRDEYCLAQHAPKQMAYDTQEKFQAQLEKWQRDMEEAHNRAELIIAKQRRSPTGKIDLCFEAEFTRFADIDLVHRTDD